MGKIEISYLDHPYPSHHNVEVTKNFLELITRLQKSSYFHFIITGGTSSCLVCPEPNVSIEDYSQISSRLHRKNIDIFTMNEIRSTIDSIKGGKLGILLDGHRVHSDIVSDVFTNDPAYVGSGPTVPGIRLTAESNKMYRSITNELGLPTLNEDLKQKLDQSSKYTSDRLTWNIIASNKDFCENLKNSLQIAMDDFEIIVVSTKINENCKIFAESLSMKFNDLSTSTIYIWAGELRTTIDSSDVSKGNGGRLSLFSYYAAQYFENTNKFDIISFATDGKDGSSPQSCYLVNNETLIQLNSYGSDLELHRYNMGSLFKSTGFSFETKLTNINFADIIILVKY